MILNGPSPAFLYEAEQRKTKSRVFRKWVQRLEKYGFKKSENEEDSLEICI